jgi:hypothetical protein
MIKLFLLIWSNFLIMVPYYGQDALSTLFSLYIRHLGPGVEFGDTHWLGRQGIALALHSIADVLASKDLPVVMTFLISRALVSSFCLVDIITSLQYCAHLTFNASYAELTG